MSDSVDDVFAAFGETSAAALVVASNEQLRTRLVDLGLSKRLLLRVERVLRLQTLKGELCSQFYGFGRQTKVAGRLADWCGAGVATLSHVAEFTVEQWRAVSGIGKKSMTELTNKLAQHGVSLGSLPLRDTELYGGAEGVKCGCRESSGDIVQFRAHELLKERYYTHVLARCQRIECIVRSRSELVEAVTRKVRYRMYSLTHAGEPGNIHTASLRRDREW